MEVGRTLQKFLSKHLTLNIIPSRQLLFTNRDFRRQYQFLREAENWTVDQVREWQTGELRERLQYAYKNCPMYQQLYDEHGVKPDEFQDLDDLRRFPTVSKEYIKSHGEHAECKTLRGSEKVYRYTGGSTGTPMKFALDKSKIFTEKAFFYYINEKYNYLMGDKCVLLKGEGIHDQYGSISRYDPFLNYLKLDSSYLNRLEMLDHYDAAIKKFGAKYLLGYPSSIYQLALLYRNSKREAPRFDHIMFSSENTYDDQIEFLTDVFQPKTVFFHYGHSEYAAMAYKYRENSRLGFSPFYGHTEILTESGLPAKPGDLGEIVVTGYSRAQPFIRYRTNDYAIASDYRSDDFMRAYVAVESIEGRLQEFIVTRDKRLVSICTMGAAHFSEFEAVYDSQYVQESEGLLFLDVVCSEDLFTDELKRSLRKSVEDKLENTVDVEVRRVNKIERTQIGKKKMIDQNLDIGVYLGQQLSNLV